MTIEKIQKTALEKYGKELTDKEAAGYAEKYGKLADDELDNVTGGGCLVETDKQCPICEKIMTRNTKTLGWDCACGYSEKPKIGIGVQ